MEGLFNPKMVNPFEYVDVHDHICMVYQTRDEQLSSLVPFIKAGLEHGEKCIYLGTENTVPSLVDNMRDYGIDADSAIAAGALEIAKAQDIYFKKSSLPTKRVIMYLKEATNLAKEEGFPGVRAACEMNWALGNYPRVERMMEFEGNLTQFTYENDLAMMCQYKVNNFGPQLTIDAINIHPMVIVNGLICKNYYYISPEDFLKLDRAYLEVKKTLDNILNDNVLALARNGKRYE